MTHASFWHLESWNEPNTSDTQFDVIIVGAGIAGLSTAYWLEQRDPTLRICITDRSQIGGGASGRNAGFVTCGSAEHFDKLSTQFGINKATEIWKFSETNRELLFQHIIQNQNDLVDFKITGSCTVSPSEEAWVRYQGIHERMRNSNIDVELISEADLRRDYGVNGFYGAIQYKNDGFVHPIKLLRLIRSKLKKTSFLLESSIQKIDANSNQVTLTTDHSRIFAKKICYCLNGFVGNLLPEFVPLIKPQRGQILLTEKLAPFVRGPCYLTKHLCYFRQLPTGELLVGGFRNVDLETENTDSENTTDKIQNALTEFTKSYFQQTGEKIKIQHRWAGVMGFSKDGQMMIGKLPERNHSFVMTGCSGHGMGLSFHAGKVLVDSMFGTEPPEHLNVVRF